MSTGPCCLTQSSSLFTACLALKASRLIYVVTVCTWLPSQPSMPTYLLITKPLWTDSSSFWTLCSSWAFSSCFWEATMSFLSLYLLCCLINSFKDLKGICVRALTQMNFFKNYTFLNIGTPKCIRTCCVWPVGDARFISIKKLLGPKTKQNKTKGLYRKSSKLYSQHLQGGGSRLAVQVHPQLPNEFKTKKQR